MSAECLRNEWEMNAKMAAGQMAAGANGCCCAHNCTAISAGPRRRVGLGRAQLEALEELGELETRGKTGATHLRVMDEMMRVRDER